VTWKRELAAARARWAPLTFYQKFEHAVVLVLTGLIAIVVVFAVWNLVLKIVLSIVVSRSFDPTDYSVFQAFFGMIFTAIIALEFKRSLLVVAERRDNVVQVRSVILIALLAVVRKLLILDVGTDTLELFGLAAAILALGAVYWIVRAGERRTPTREPASREPEPHAGP
jgi:uncharacterized membrane protein (DUF373 family)